MNNKVIALGDYVLLKKIPESDREVDGIFMPNSQLSLLTKAQVLSIGKGENIDKLYLKEGDLIYYNEIESNCVASDGTGEGAYFVRHDLIYGKIETKESIEKKQSASDEFFSS
jgi:co-chaperonin GroES (HSP10)